jgi:hypothetical protein
MIFGIESSSFKFPSINNSSPPDFFLVGSLKGFFKTSLFIFSLIFEPKVFLIDG